MVKLSVLYPNETGKAFDMAYYCNQHIPMVRQLLGPACTHAAVDLGIAGGTPGSIAPYIAIGHLYFDKVEDFVASFTPHANTIMADLSNYTDTTPTIQISEVKM
ncbi:MAG: EthD family reductase [Bacteroidota bacterium]|nr:EthD family reductase [Bacteroidota bacterium]